MMDVRNSPTYQRLSSPSGETKLCIIIDSNTPIVSRIPLTPGTLTLGTFKTYADLNDDCYKFYFKSHDPEFGTVKEELVDDDSILPVEDGRTVVWVISNNNLNKSTLFGSENPYNQLGDNAQMDSQPSFYKRPASIEFNQQAHPEPLYDQMIYQSANVLANLHLSSNENLGLTILCPSNATNHAEGLLIDKVQPNSIAARKGRILSGDKIVEINGIDLRLIPTNEAIMKFKQIVDSKGAINLSLHRNGSGYGNSGSHNWNARCPDKPVELESRATRRVTDGGFDPATELPIPIIDPDAFPAFERYPIQRKDNISQDTYSLPRSLTPRSLYTTSNLDTLTSSTDLRLALDSQSVYGPNTPGSIRQITVALHCSKDTIGTIYAHLKLNAASLDIRDREWLKVVVKNAFLGSTLVKWLSRNVYGFCNRSETKRYANKMLSLGLIKSPMSSGTFTEKCYYVLT